MSRQPMIWATKSGLRRLGSTNETRPPEASQEQMRSIAPVRGVTVPAASTSEEQEEEYYEEEDEEYFE